jgi:hypothetical protein
MKLERTDNEVANDRRPLNIPTSGIRPGSKRNSPMSTVSRFSRLLVLPFVLVASAACEDDEVTAPLSTDLPSELVNLAQGIHPVLSIPELGRTGGGELVEIRIHVHSVNVEGDVASYQGEFRFDPEALSIVEGEFPEGLLGAWNEIEPGLIRFAGVTLEGLGEGVALTLVAETHRALTAPDFEIDLEELVSSEGFTDLTDQVVGRDTPILTRYILGVEQR